MKYFIKSTITAVISIQLINFWFALQYGNFDVKYESWMQITLWLGCAFGVSCVMIILAWYIEETRAKN